MTAFTYLVELTGQPAMSLPLDRLASGFPIGSQVIGRFGHESTLFRLAGQLERAQSLVRSDGVATPPVRTALPARLATNHASALKKPVVRLLPKQLLIA
jgi:hypothetical protein